MADTMTLEELRESLDVGCLPNTDRPRWFAAIDAAIRQREQGAKDAARYRWLLENSRMFSSPECDGLQLPITFCSLNDFDLTQAIDDAMARESGNE